MQVERNSSKKLFFSFACISSILRTSLYLSMSVCSFTGSATSSSYITGFRWIHTAQFSCRTSDFSNLFSNRSPLTMTIFSSSATSIISFSNIEEILCLSIIPLHGAPIINSWSLLILFSIICVTIFLESQPFAMMAIFSFLSVR